jgi:hypothetical protein
MNEHLKPVFKILLTKIENEGIDYWVFGGISIAAYAGKFIRDNKDVDIFVKEIDFQKTKSILNNVCEINGFELIPHIPQEEGKRPKLDIKINGKELLSVVPAYLKSNIVEFKFGKITDQYSQKILEKVERNIDGNKFYTSSDEYIKKFILNHLIARKDKINRPEIRADIEAVFTLEEKVKFKLL